MITVRLKKHRRPIFRDPWLLLRQKPFRAWLRLTPAIKQWVKMPCAATDHQCLIYDAASMLCLAGFQAADRCAVPPGWTRELCKRRAKLEAYACLVKQWRLDEHRRAKRPYKEIGAGALLDITE